MANISTIFFLIMGFLGVFGLPTTIHLITKDIRIKTTIFDLVGCGFGVMSVVSFIMVTDPISNMKNITDFIIIIICAIIGIGISLYLLKLHHSTNIYVINKLYHQINSLNENIKRMADCAKNDSEYNKIQILMKTKRSLEKQILNLFLQDSITICKKVELNPRNGINIQREIDELEALQKLSSVEGGEVKCQVDSK